MAFSEGQSLQNGKYTIDRVLNSGRFGVSYLAHDGRKQRFVIKTFRDDIWQQKSDAEKKQIQNSMVLLRWWVLTRQKFGSLVAPSF